MTLTCQSKTVGVYFLVILNYIHVYSYSEYIPFWQDDKSVSCFLWCCSMSCQEYFAHMAESPLPVKGCKNLAMLGTNGLY